MKIAHSVFSLYSLISFITTTTAKLGLPPRIPPRKYVHLGDSWASGIGTYPRNIIGNNPSCQLTNASFAEQYARENNLKGDAYHNLACAPQVLADMIKKVPQIPSDTDLVSYIGDVNMLEFANVLHHCELEYAPNVCREAIRKAQQAEKNTLSQLMNMLNAINAQAKNARIVIMGFPRLYGSVNGRASLCDPVSGAINSQDTRDDINKFVMNIFRPSKSSDYQNNNTLYMDPDPVFDNHRYCDHDLWFASSSETSGPDPFIWNNGFFHPNAAGHRAYKDLLTEAWNA